MSSLQTQTVQISYAQPAEEELYALPKLVFMFVKKGLQNI